MPPNLRDDPYGYIDHSLTNHPPEGDTVVARFELLREQAKRFGRAIVDNCPATPERTLAIRHLEQSLMWATKSVACNQEALTTVEASVTMEPGAGLSVGSAVQPGVEPGTVESVDPQEAPHGS